MQCWQVRITGRVQGVGYRETCVRRASALGVTGWVRNRIDGSVEALLQGSADRLARLHEWLRVGPPLARVEQVQVTALEPPFPHFERFERRATE